MNKSIISLLSLFLILNACQTNSGTKKIDAQEYPELTSTQDSIIASQLNVFPKNTQISMAFIQNGEITYHGFMMKDTLVRVINNDSVFEIGSITKVFTSTLLAHFVNNGQIKLDESINNYLPFEIKDNIQLSFQQLANHTSGLPRMPGNFQPIAMKNILNPFKEYDEKAMSDYLSNYLDQEYNPEQGYSYSNLGAGLLGYTLEQISGKSYEQLLDSLITQPLKMDKTTTQREKVQQNLVKGLNALGEHTPNWDLNVLMGAGGIVSSVEDLSKYALAQFDTTNIAMALTRKKTYEHSENLALGLGWHLIKKNGYEYVWHNGATGGYISSMGLDMENNNAVIILLNISAYHSNSSRVSSITFDLLSTLN
jgi:CubicO group peptidase (beta-lactamase class C family)